MVSINVGLAAALGFMVPMGAQIDALIALGLGPAEFDLAASFNAALSAQATLTLQIGDPTVAIQIALQAVMQLQAALQASLTLPPVTLSLNAELSATAALAASLAAKLGSIKLLIEASLAVKIPAMKLAGDLTAALSAGGTVFLQYFDGQLDSVGGEVASAFGSGLAYGAHAINPTDAVVGVLITAAYSASMESSVKLLFGVP